MAKTRHLGAQTNRRGIKSDLLELVKCFGTNLGDKTMVTRNQASALIKELDRIRRQALDVEKKGGLIIVEENGYEITAYRCEGWSNTSKNTVCRRDGKLKEVRV